MSRPRFLPEISVAGILFIVGAFLWRSSFAPVPDQAPELASPDVPGQVVVPPVPVAWKIATPAQRATVTAPILAQLQAFKRDDYRKAVTYQSAGLRRNFPSLQNFRSMIKSQYPQFAAYKTIQFSKILISSDGRQAQAVIRLTGRDGLKVRAAYLMIREKAGFRVAGVSGGAADVQDGTAV